MTQVNSAQRNGRKVASTVHARVRTLAARRADFERQVRLRLAADPTMALTEPEQVSARLKELRKRAGGPPQYKVANALDVPPRTFQSWENGEVETDRANYERVARYYSKQLKQKITSNWILFGQDVAPPLNGDRDNLETPDVLSDLSQKPDQGVLADIVARLDTIQQNQQDLAALIEASVGALTVQSEAILEQLRPTSEQQQPAQGRGRKRAA
jgi:DNA-binding XRE family transcriptional regulator